MPTKKGLLLISFLLSAVLLTWNYIGNYRVCDFIFTNGSEGNCPYFLTGVGISFLPLFPLFLFSLVTYKMRGEVSRAWMRFSVVWIPLSIILSYLTPESSGGGFGPSISIGRGDTALAMSALFIIISLIIIVWKYIATRKM